MLAKTIVRLIAAATINPDSWEMFLQLMAETKAIVRQEGDNVLIHECYYDPATFRCTILESYASEQAFLKHLEVIRPLSDKFKVDWKIERLELLGAYSSAIVAAMKKSNGDIEVVHFANVFENK